MTKETFNKLQPGDIVQHVDADSGLGGHTWMVSANYGESVVLVETAHMSNPNEWQLVLKVYKNSLDKVPGTE